jgi:hypothetical protein
MCKCDEGLLERVKQQTSTLSSGTASLRNFPEVLLKWKFSEMKTEKVGALKKLISVNEFRF